MTIKVEHYGVEGIGRTVGEAKRDAGRKIERMLSGDYSPQMRRRKNVVAFIFRHPMYGWSYVTHVDGEDPSPYPSVHHGFDDHTRDEMIVEATYHAAQVAWDGEDGDELEELARDLDRSHKSQLISWAKWQLRYRASIAEGCDSETAWNLASGLPGVYQPVA